MMDKIEVSQRFYFKGALVVAAVCSAFVAFGIYVFLRAAKEGSIWEGAAFLLCDFLVFGIAGFNAVVSKSDILITERDISRSLLGVILLSLRWDQVEKIDVFKSNNGNLTYPRMVRVFNLYPKSKLRLRFIGLRRLTFDEQVQNVDDLVKLLNKYAAQYKIPLTQADDNYVRHSVSSL